ncbi:MAG: DUF4238 domain-containing protein [Sphingobacterium mizutaii]|nr:DUF4238 domain-containing protein [Sphingobacterium mizutaii]
MNKETKEFERLNRNLLSRLEKIFKSRASNNDADIEELIRLSSKNHHYIPRYYINGFLGNDKEMFVYDKYRDQIRNKKSGSRGVFFEENRNSLQLADNRFISLFEEIYCLLDDTLPATIKVLTSDADELTEQLQRDLISSMNIFIVDLFLRNKNNDAFYDEKFSSARVQVLNSHLNHTTEEIKSVPGVKQLFRAHLFITYLEEFLRGDPNQITQFQLLQFPFEQVCIGDNPILFLRKEKELIDLNHTPLILPICKTKIYLRNVQRKRPFGYEHVAILNALIIDQSSHLICCSNRKALEDAVKTYKHMQKGNLFDMFRASLFFDIERD